MAIFYHYGSELYVNITNRCHCKCFFCVRNRISGLGDSDTLWLDHEPDLAELIAEYEQLSLADYDQVVFCGYGEPMERLDLILDFCRYLRKNSEMKIRINTNGLGDLINAKPTAELLAGMVDAVSISLNAPNAKRYAEITNPSFGERSFEALLKFAADCKRYIPQVRFTIVDVLTPQETAACRQLAREMGIPLRIRPYGRS